jgi:general L-amino acid transport system permease protein
MTWARKHLFNSRLNTLLTVIFAAIVALVLFRLERFVFITGRWAIIRKNLTLLLVGLFPRSELWRVWAALYVLTIAVSVFAGAIRRRAVVPGADDTHERLTLRRGWPLALFVVVALTLRPSIVGAVAILGLAAAAFGSFRAGRALGISFRSVAIGCGIAVVGTYVVVVSFGGVDPDEWGGLMLTFTLATVGILLSFPFGVALALGRRSTLPAVRVICTAYIELVRGVPLITLLFMGFFVVGFVLPPGTSPPRLITRAIVAIVMFTAAYIAEIVRGGLLAVGRGQLDAALAVGLTPIAAMRFIVLPQALRAVIPGLVGQFITLFKDTSLVAIVGLSELLGIAQVLTSQGEFLAQGLQAETLIFAAFIYWVFSYTMSRESQRLERRLGVGTR